MPPRTPSGATPLRWVTPRRLSPLDQRQKWHGWRCGLHADSRRLRRAHRPVRWRHVGTHVRTSRRRRLLDSRHRTTSSRSRTVCRSVLKDGETARPRSSPMRCNTSAAASRPCSSTTARISKRNAVVKLSACRARAPRRLRLRRAARSGHQPAVVARRSGYLLLAAFPGRPDLARDAAGAGGSGERRHAGGLGSRRRCGVTRTWMPVSGGSSATGWDRPTVARPHSTATRV